MKTFETLKLELDDGLLWLTLNRPEKLNTFTVTMANELIEAFAAISEDDTVRVVIVTGAGKAFCAGMDLSKDGNVFGLDESLTPTLADLDDRYDDPVIVNGLRDTGVALPWPSWPARSPSSQRSMGPRSASARA